ncbi:he65 [Trichoplusia ni granulovirus LBIV-12]|uniref:He65 n=1 Tax=Trichoplusia ni granulovirus LBIV-12 TaxID=1916701 RepID=A0A1D8QL91_GVTN|nr:he65 [Trichoplusia ni granulovirus LBIV-12]AOW41393.1 he65 [Trichoplusia ni granulovirus LBIV-12]
MVYIKVDIGSHAKGYSTESSDHDYVIFTKCSEDDFLHYINNRQHLVNVHKKNEDGDDCTYVDLYNGLYGIYAGNYYYLGVFAEEKDVVDKNGLPNSELFTFIRQLTRLRMLGILQTMLRFKVRIPTGGDKKKKGGGDQEKKQEIDPKNLLNIMYNNAYVDRWLRTKQFPQHNRLPELLDNNQQRVELYKELMLKRVNQTPASEQEKDYIDQWQKQLQDKLAEFPPLPERFDVLKAIVRYAMNDSGPVMPFEKNITKLLYPSIQQLSRAKSGALWGQLVTVQEKLDGCNFRIIVNGEDRIRYGSRNTYREYSDFMGFYRIRARLEACARRLQTVTGYESFVVYGELVGWRDDKRQKPINDIHYRDQEEPIKFYAYEILRYDGEVEDLIEFELGQNLLYSSGQFDTIPYESMLYDDFVAKPIVYKSLLFPNHGEELVEGYVLRCNGLRYKIKEEYKLDNLGDTNVLHVITKSFVDGVLDGKKVDAENFDKCMVACYDAVEPYNTSFMPVEKIFGKLFGLLCAQAGIKHTEYKLRFIAFKTNKEIY